MNFLHRTWAEIDIDALIHNFKIIQARADGAKLMAVVKADAYGHSAKDTAPVLERLGADAFAVSNIEEALTLRRSGITRPILILGYTPAELAAELAENHITQCVFSPEYAAALSNQAQADGVTVKIHIKLDTGMSRIGFDCRTDALDGVAMAVEAARLPGFCFDGVFTHFAVSDRTPDEEDGFTDSQYRRFCAAIEQFRAAGLNPRVCHCCNSAAFCLDTEKHFDLCRPGIILYGLTPADGLELGADFIPVMTFKSVVSMVKTIHKGDTVSYGRTYCATGERRIATVTVGYADGYPRLLSGRGSVLIGGKRAKIVGRVCMDQMAVDVTDLPDVREGDEVILFGKELPVEELAALCGTINYEIVCGISPRVPRIIKKSKTEKG